MVNIIIVDDSKFMRVALEKLLSKNPYINIIGILRNGIEAIKFIKAHDNIDVIILDCFMPKMDGIETLRNIMKYKPTPTIMITIANKKEHADLYFNALKLGAFDIIPKPSGLNSLYIDQVEDILLDRIFMAEKSKSKLIKRKATEKRMNQINLSIISKRTGESQKLIENRDFTSFLHQKSGKGKDKISRTLKYVPSFKLFVIGASTGGPPRVSEMISRLKFSSNVAVIIIQHMPAAFTANFAKRLNKLTKYTLSEGMDGDIISPGRGYVAPGGYHIELKLKRGRVVLKTNKKPKMHAIRPAIDITLPSVAEIFQYNAAVTIITGMGKDGSVNLHLIKEFGGMTIAQDPNEALIDSMPVSAIKTGMIDKILPIKEIIDHINNRFISNAITI
ncbi:MAG: chemotaxis-specific protein-glutamate methyltransferase CheB [Promethearchaeota archaeon]